MEEIKTVKEELNFKDIMAFSLLKKIGYLKKQQQQCTHITQTYKSSTRQMIKQNQINTNKETDTKQRKQKISKERSK